MIDFFESRFNLDSAFVEEQMQNGSVSNCIPESLLTGFAEQAGQHVYKDVNVLKADIDYAFVGLGENPDQQLSDVKQIISLLEIGTNKQLKEPKVLNEAFAVSRRKVINYLQSIVLKQRMPKRFCDQYTPDKLKDAVTNRPRKLWGKLLHEGTNTILFSDNGVGKTQLSMMIADGIAKGESTIFGLEVESPNIPRLVVYYDFEMTEAMLLKRYGFNSESDVEGLSTEEIKSRLPQFKRVDFITMQDELIEGGFNEKELNRLDRVDLLFLHIEWSMTNYVPYSLLFVVDNITSVCYKTEDNGTAQEFMNRFVELKQKFGPRFTSLILAHTPKIPRDRLLMKEHLKGAKSLSDLADEVVGLKQSSQSEDMFYLKQFKGRVDGKDFDEDHVLVFERMVTDAGSFTLKVMDQTEREVLHIKTDEATKREIEDESAKLILKHQDLINESFAVLEDFPEDTGLEDRVNYLFNATEVSEVVYNKTKERIPVRQISKLLNDMDVQYVTKKIGADLTKKGYMLSKS